MAVLALILLAVPLPGAELSISCGTAVVLAGQRAPDIRISLKNKGQSKMLVVQPNDGCEWHLRTPYIGWAIKPVGDSSPWPAKPPKLTDMRCGNIDPLTEKQLIDLQPGQSVDVGAGTYSLWPMIKKPGQYRVVFYYWHVTKSDQYSRAGFGGPRIIDRVLASEPYQLRSNELIFTVKPKRA